MNSNPPITEQVGDGWTRGWSNWFEQVSLALRGLKKSMNYTATIDFGAVSAQSQASSNVTITGARSGDAVQVTPTTDVSGMVFTGVVTAVDTVTVYAKNFSAGAINPASQVFRIVVLQN